MTAVIEGFRGLKPFLQQAVVMKANGVSNIAIATNIHRSVKTVERWFGAEGILYKPLLEYSEMIANDVLAEARMLMRQALPTAVQTLVELSQTAKNASIRQQAAKTLAQPSIAVMARNMPAYTPSLAGNAISEMLESELASAAGIFKDYNEE